LCNETFSFLQILATELFLMCS